MCNVEEESMLHIVRCRAAKPFWNKVFHFIRTVLHCPDPALRDQAIILNRWKRDDVGPPEACACIRHAVGAFYRDFTLIDTLNKPFNPSKTFHRAVSSFHKAVVRYGVTIHKHYLANVNSPRKAGVSKAVAKQFPSLIAFDDRFAHSLSPALTDAVNKAANDAK